MGLYRMTLLTVTKLLTIRFLLFYSILLEVKISKKNRRHRVYVIDHWLRIRKN